MFQALKGITGLVRSGALKKEFDVEIEFKGKINSVIAKKKIFQAQKGIIFLNNFLNDLKDFQKNGFSKGSEESINRFKSVFTDVDLQEIIKDGEINDSYQPIKMTLIAKNKKRYPFMLKKLDSKD